MSKSIVDFDFSDVTPKLARFLTDVVAQEEKVGEEAVEYAVKNGTYPNRTGNLRRSNRYQVDASGLELTNTADYATSVEARGYDVLSGAALYAEKRLKEIFGE